MEEKIISIASPKRKIYFKAVPIAEETLDENGRVTGFKGTIPDGPVVEFNANLKTSKNYKNGVLDGKLYIADINTGKVSFTEEYENGELKKFIDTATMMPVSPKSKTENSADAPVPDITLEEPFMKGLAFVKNKESIVFYEDGKEVAKRSLLEGNTIAGKIPDGVFKEYTEGGAVRTQAEYKNNMLNGEMLRYDDISRLLSKEYYVEGILTGDAQYFLYFPHGKSVAENAHYDNGLINGPRQMLIDNEKPLVIENYSNGKLEGRREVYFENNGILSMEENYKNGRYDGNRILYHNNGAVWYKEFYKNGQLEGERTAYFPNGELYLKERYVKGLLEGEKRIYDQNGTILFQEEYSFGAPVKKRKY